MKSFKWIILLLLTASCIDSCKKGTSADIPAYIHVNGFTPQIDSALYGPVSVKVPEVWAYADDIFLGGYDLPVTFPALKQGKKPLTLEAGVYINDISSTLQPYPFYAPYTVNVDYEPAHIDTIKPVIRYRDNTKVALLEGFEGATHYIQADSRNTAYVTYTNNKDSAFRGNGVLEVDLTTAGNKNIFECISGVYNFTKGNEVWMEMNYRNTANFEVGIYSIQNGASTKVPIVGMSPTGKKWNKIYVKLSDVIADQANSSTISLYFYTVMPSTQAEGKIFIDNIKLLYFD